MAKKKTARKKRTAPRKKKTARPKKGTAPRKRKTAPRKKSAAKRSPARPKTAGKAAKPARKKAVARVKKRAKKSPPPPRAKSKPGGIAARRKPAAPARRGRRDANLNDLVPYDDEARDPALGVDSGGTMGLSREELAGPESVEELVDEGQAFEAGILDGVENAPDADRGPIKTREVPEDDVPQEYIDQERDRP